MTALIGLTNRLGAVNAVLLALCLRLGALCMGLMVVIILAQVFFRYFVGSALAWPEEASRFLMLWATGLMAATAFRRSGFVAIDMVVRLLPARVTAPLAVLLLALSGLVLWVGLNIAWSEVTGIGGRFETDSLRVPVSLTEWMKVPKSWMMSSLLVGVFLLLAVNVELFLRSLTALLGGHDALEAIPETIVLGAE